VTTPYTEREPAPLAAAVYARKSTDQSRVSDEQRSIARQHARAYAARQGWAVAAEPRL
jgi:hypothetical protein